MGEKSISEGALATREIGTHATTKAWRRTIWIDLDNSPHVPFFKPIIEDLENRGYSVMLTARDCFQVCGLAELLKLRCRAIGRHYGKHKLMKLFGLAIRTLQLLPLAARTRPVLALSHGSRSQLLAAKILRIPSLQIGDYEFAKVWAFFRPSWVMVPDVISEAAVDCDPQRLLKYPGIKEDVYVCSFAPSSDVRPLLGVRESDILITMRPPANEAHYHNPESDKLFESAVKFVSVNPASRIVMLPRNDRQADQIRTKWRDLCSSEKLIIPSQVVNGLDLIWSSDLVISGGGTMNREAAALGVPVYSVFRGKIGAVDQYLNETGRLSLIESAAEVSSKIVLSRRVRAENEKASGSAARDKIVDAILRIVGARC
jgi:predicted glycosyltransferase